MPKTTHSNYDFIKLGHRIQSRRKELGLTQEQLAEKVDCSLTHLCRIESGHRPSLITLLRLSTFLGYSLDDLAGITPKRNPYLQEVSDLFYTHTSKEQFHALQVLRIFFQIIDQMNNNEKEAAKWISETPEKEYFYDDSFTTETLN